MTSSTSIARQHSLGRSRGEPETLYFAYGSNLCLAQMAQRCPTSIFRGKATLSGYRWQINERGVANVVPSQDDLFVEGLVYSVNQINIKALDRAEGVSKDFYQKHLLKVTFQPHSQYSGIKSVRLAEVLASTRRRTGGLLSQAPDSYQDTNSSSGPGDQEGLQQDAPRNVKALVYVSANHTTDGLIRKEYIARMQKAIDDAAELGVSRAFIEESIVPRLDLGNMMPPATPAPRETLTLEPQSLTSRDIVEGTSEQANVTPVNDYGITEVSMPQTEPLQGDAAISSEWNQELSMGEKL